jgi:hypothetical protein
MAAADKGTTETVDLTPETVVLTPETVVLTPETVNPIPETANLAPEPAERTPEQVRQEIEAEREQLVGALADLRSDVDRAANKVKSRLPAAVVVGVGIGATMHYLARRRRR